MNYMLQYGEDEDYQDDYEAGSRRKKLISKIRKRMSIVKPKKREDDDEEEDEESTGNDDDERYGFRKRQLKKRQERKQKEQQQQQQKGRKEKPTRANSKEKLLVVEETRRKSLLHIGMPRLSSSRRKLPMSALSRAAPPRDLGEEEEDDDVAMPLPGHAHEDMPDLAELLTPSGNEKETAKDGKKRRFLKPLSSSKKSSKRASQASKKEKGKFSDSSTGEHRSSANKAKFQQSSDQSVDSPPTVASTESSTDGGAAQHHAPRRGQSRKQRGSGSGPFFKFKNGDDDDAGGDLDDCVSVNTQSIPWIIKTWIYFVTVVVPFTILYYCFVGIGHSSTTLHENPILRKVCFANILFNGMGCTYRTGFWAKQALDARGIHSVTTANRTTTTTTTNCVETIISPPPAIPKMEPFKKLSKGHRHGPRPGRSLCVSFNPMVDLLSPFVPGSSSDQFSRTMRGSTMMCSRPTSNGGARSSQVSGVRSSVFGGNSGGRNMGGSGMRTSRNEQQARSRAIVDERSSNTLTTSAWDVEHLIPLGTKKKTSAPSTRPSMNKHDSILEIYEMHAEDEKMALLQ
jgi:hypothetical protein